MQSKRGTALRIVLAGVALATLGVALHEHDARVRISPPTPS